ncbi:flagellar basal-body MS-ring/collar protein FliF [Alphaproteobacteria bacterium LSUCC0684]
MAEAASMDEKNGSLTLAQGTGPLSSIRRMTADPSIKKSMPMIISVIALTVGLVMYMFIQKPAVTTLYASLPDAEKARVVEALRNGGMDVSVDPTTGDVLVPVRDYHSSRIMLAAQGLPTSVPEGYSGIGDIPLGASRSVENVKIRQAQEMELARSISEIDGVVAARVHLAIPEKSVFARSAVPPSASVFMQMSNGRTLGQHQVSAIVHLVSSSVPSMAKSDVTIVDQYGNLLSKPVDDPSNALSDSELEHRMKLEQIYRARIISLVSPIVGAGNVTAQVNLEMDFTRSEVTEELVDPEANALRSSQSSLDVTANAGAKGIPGATTNSPPAATELKSDFTNQGSSGGGVQTRSSNEVRNFEVSRTISTTRKPSNQITNIQAAVLVREMVVENPDTGEKTVEKIPPEKLKELEALIADAIGINPERGDRLTVSSSTFVSVIEGFEKPWFEMDWAVNLMKQSMTLLIMGVIILGVIRPMINRIMVPIAPGKPGEALVHMEDEPDMDQVEIGEGESLEDIKSKLKPKKASISAEMLDTANTYDDKVAVIRMIVSDEAGRVSNVFKAMMKPDLDAR